MAPLLRGEHFAVKCGDCSWKFACGREHPPQAGIAVCPNCGHQQQVEQPLQPGDLLRIWPVDRNWAPARGDLVVLNMPQQPGILAVKRVAALPGEALAFESGDLLLNGRRLQKDLRQLQEIAIPVYSDAARSRMPRWKTAPGWAQTPGGYHFAPAAAKAGRNSPAAPGEFAWLSYRHLRCYRSPSPRQPSPVTDSYGYNQSLSRTPRDVRDLLVTFEFRGAGRLRVAINTTARPTMLEIDVAAGAIRILIAGKTVAKLHADLAPRAASNLEGPPWRRVAFAICDGRALYALDGVAGRPAGVDPGINVTTQPIAIGARDAEIEIRNLLIKRDIYYTPPPRAARDASKRNKSGNALPLNSGFYLLGDNPPASNDSRHWPARIPRSAIVGRAEVKVRH